jgi:FtsZ-binding cell division protein ZapB
LQKVERRIRNLVQAVELAEHDLAESALEEFKEKLDSLRKEKASLEARKANLNPEARIEVSRMGQHITWVKRLLDQGGLVIEPEGI